MRDGFDDEWLGKDVEVEQVKGVIRGRVVDVSKYWLKLLVNGEVVYINKAYIASIKPAVIKDTAGGGNAGAGQSRAG
jgi:acetolactate synthase small subunit